MLLTRRPRRWRTAPPRCLLCMIVWCFYAAISIILAAAGGNKNLYDVLEVASSATSREIKRAYRKMAVKLHPDKQPADKKEEFEALFIELANAYEVLSDPDKRASYDRNPSAFDAENASGGFDDFEAAFNRYGYGEIDTPLNWAVVLFVSSLLVAPLTYAGWKKLTAKPPENASRAELLDARGLGAPKTEMELAARTARREASKRDARERKKAARRRKDQRQAAAEERARAARENAVEAQIEAHVPAMPRPNAGAEGVDAAPGAARRSVHAEQRSVKVPWTAEEDSLLLKAVKKYPGGTPQRWKKVAQYVGTRAQDVVLKRVKQLKIRVEMVIPRGGRADWQASAASAAAGVSASKPDTTADDSTVAAAEWTADEQARLEMALKSVPPSAGLSKGERWDKIAGIVGTRSRGACAKRFKALRAQLRSADGR